MLLRPIIFSMIFSFIALEGRALANDFEVVTTPSEAEIYLKREGKEAIKIGKSPLKLTSEELARQVGSEKTFLVEIKKRGFEDYRVMMVRSTGARVKMEVLLEVNKEISTIRKHDMLMGELFKVQRLIRSNNFSDALAKLDELEKENQEFSIISELKGIAYYMKRDINNALSMFRIAFGKNSKNRDAYKMKVYLEKKLGLDAEAN